MSTFEKIRHIFFSGGFAFTGIQESINEIAFLVDEGYLILQTITIADKDQYRTILNNRSNLTDKDEASGGSIEHIVLKILAEKYLRQERQQESHYEHSFCGYFPDVLSDDNLSIVECGHTQNAEKMLVYFRQGNIRECIQIPYPDQNDKLILGYSFTGSSTLNEFLEFMESEKRNKIKKILQKRN